MTYNELVYLATKMGAAFERPSSWYIAHVAKRAVLKADMAEFLQDNLEMVCEMIDHGVGIEQDDEDYLKRAVEVSLEDVLRELLEEKLRALLQAEWDRARQRERAGV